MNHTEDRQKDLMLTEALQLAKAGYCVFPVGRDNKPLIEDWPNQASIDESQIRQWYDKPNPPNLAVVTGHKSGCFCLYVDGGVGRQSLAELEEKYGEAVNISHVCCTPADGRHYFFKMPPEQDIHNSAGKIGKNLDIRGNGGYVLVWPSIAVNLLDKEVAAYGWLISALGEGGLPEAPQWLLELVTENKIKNPDKTHGDVQV